MEMSGAIDSVGAQFGPGRLATGIVARGRPCSGLIRGGGPDAASSVRDGGVAVCTHFLRLDLFPGDRVFATHARARHAVGTRFAIGDPVQGLLAHSCLSTNRSRDPAVVRIFEQGPAPRVLRFHARPHALQKTISTVVAGGGRRRSLAMTMLWLCQPGMSGRRSHRQAQDHAAAQTEARAGILALVNDEMRAASFPTLAALHMNMRED